jgi:5-methylcytosine-specific restriction endonuclease McrA
MKKIPEFNIEREVRGAMRRVFVRTPARREALMAVRREVPKFNGDGARSKKDSVQYQCALCQNWIKSTEVSVDHIVPVVSIDESFIDYNTFAARLFCSKENLQVACLACHEKKTLLERLDPATSILSP